MSFCQRRNRPDCPGEGGGLALRSEGRDDQRRRDLGGAGHRSDWRLVSGSDAAELARKLASRRTPIEDLDGLLDEFVAKAGGERDVRLTRVFAGALELINAERDRVMSGIVRCARGQTGAAGAQGFQRCVRRDGGEPVGGESAEDAQTKLKWDKRIFEERSRSLTYVCKKHRLCLSGAPSILRGEFSKDYRSPSFHYRVYN